MIVKLKEIVQIQSGIYRKPDFNGDTIYLQVKDFNENGSLNSKKILQKEIKCDERLAKHILKNEDLLFASKGEKNFTYKYNSQVGQAFASSTFFVLRINDFSIVSPDYLQWYLNHPNTQEYIKAFSRGATVPSIPKKDILEIEIMIPSLKKQNLILDIDQLVQKEKFLIKQLHAKRQLYYNTLLFNTLRK